MATMCGFIGPYEVKVILLIPLAPKVRVGLFEGCLGPSIINKKI